MTSDLVIVTNRGPAEVEIGPKDELVVRHAAGGLAPSLSRALLGSGALWIASAMSQGERRARREGLDPSLVGGIELAFVEVGAQMRQDAYAVIANSTLWYLHHGMFDSIRTPVFDRDWHEAWSNYRQYNAAFAGEIAAQAGPGATVIINDYHLALIGEVLSVERPDLKTVHFTHTPFCTPGELARLPRAVAEELLGALACFGTCGFHTKRWADNYLACAEEVLARSPASFVAPLGSDAAELAELAGSPEVRTCKAGLSERLAGRRLILRSDRIEPSKNLVRGFLAFEELLDNEPRLAKEVLFLARSYASRTDLSDYIRYRQEVELTVQRINARFADGGPPPIELEVSDDFSATVAGLTAYDLLVVNPIRDGMNLVAKEGPLLNTRDGVLLLSTEAGAFAELGEASFSVQPWDVSATAKAMSEALRLEPGERHRRARLLAQAASANPPALWLEHVLAEARPTASRPS